MSSYSFLEKNRKQVSFLNLLGKEDIHYEKDVEVVHSWLKAALMKPRTSKTCSILWTVVEF